jgi:integrase/recombinase XerC/integrase/recombinase XerD
MFDHDPKNKNERMTRLKFDALDTWVNAFVRDCKTRGLSDTTVAFYRQELKLFCQYCEGRGADEVQQVTADILRDWLDYLKTDRKRNEGGRHASYRAIRAFLRWWERESEPETWSNPMRKVKPPKPSKEVIPGVSLADVSALLKTCDGTFTGIRDRAVILCLLDTGARATEFLSLNIDDLDFIDGAVAIHKGKGNKSRTVFIGKKSRRAVRAWLKIREDNSPALWVTKQGERLARESLRNIFTRRAETAGIESPSAHDFRRAFALNMLRSGVDLITLSRLMGHSDIQILRVYLAQNSDDLRAAHDRGGPVDRL